MNYPQRISVLTMTVLMTACASPTRLQVSETRPAPAPFRAIPVALNTPQGGQLETGDFSCEMGNHVDVKVDAGNNMSLNWKGHTYSMAPVTTSTGALRFENKSEGLVWIQIPAKSMLLSSKMGQQLANECRSH